MKRRIAILGATGSIGQSTLDVVARHPSRFDVFALAAATRWREMAQLCLKFSPRLAVMVDADAASELRTALTASGSETTVLAGSDALEMIAAHADTDVVMAAIVGAAGLKSSLAAAEVGKTVLLANKEALVMAGRLFMDAVHTSGAVLLPIDSEHNAIFQCLPTMRGSSLRAVGVHKIVLTASGGPFRTRAIETLERVTPEEACAHPNWVMGRKISVDSATMMNKGLEVIEAHWLFNAPADLIEVVIHPQSVIHSMVSYRDGSVLAQLGNPDMRTPIAFGLAYPERIDAGVAPLDFSQIAKLEFAALDLERFPCVRLAYEALRAGGTAPAILNAANEVAVAAFLDGQLAFTRIASLVEEVMSGQGAQHANSLADVLAADATARAGAAALIAGRPR